MRRKAASAAQSLLALLRAMNVDKYAVLPIHLMSTAFKQSATRYSANKSDACMTAPRSLAFSVSCRQSTSEFGPVADELKHNLFIMRNRDATAHATALLLITTSDNDGVQFCGVFCQ